MTFLCFNTACPGFVHFLHKNHTRGSKSGSKSRDKHVQQIRNYMRYKIHLKLKKEMKNWRKKTKWQVLTTDMAFSVTSKLYTAVAWDVLFWDIRCKDAICKRGFCMTDILLGLVSFGLAEKTCISFCVVIQCILEERNSFWQDAPNMHHGISMMQCDFWCCFESFLK